MIKTGERTAVIELDRQEIELLIKHLQFLRNLFSGNRPPETDAQRRFCAVCRGEEKPKSPYEIAFIKWLVSRPTVGELKRRLENGVRDRQEKATTKPARVRSFARGISASTRREVEQRYLASQEPAVPDMKELVRHEKKRQAKVEERRAAEPTTSRDDYTPRFVKETWGTRADWKKDKSRNKYNGR